MDRCGIAYTQERGARLVAKIDKLKPFPDVIAALDKQRARATSLRSSPTAIADMLKPPARTSRSASTTSSRSRKRLLHSRTGRPTQKLRRSSAESYWNLFVANRLRASAR